MVNKKLEDVQLNQMIEKKLEHGEKKEYME
jgi:hypothetical protein